MPSEKDLKAEYAKKEAGISISSIPNLRRFPIYMFNFIWTSKNVRKTLHLILQNQKSKQDFVFVSNTKLND